MIHRLPSDRFVHDPDEFDRARSRFIDKLMARRESIRERMFDAELAIASTRVADEPAQTVELPKPVADGMLRSHGPCKCGCGVEVRNRSKRGAYATDACERLVVQRTSQKRRDAAKAKRAPIPKRICVGCNKEWQPTDGRTVCCSPRCSLIRKKRWESERAQQQKEALEAKRVARELERKGVIK